MYSIGPLPKQKRSGKIVGTHQKIDRVARRHLTPLIDMQKLYFPTIREILHFEGMRGPDGAKLKSPGKDEPWHFIDPNQPTKDRRLLDAIENHRCNLADALRTHNIERASFEAAWLAHAVTDGLTPAHHVSDLEELRADDARTPSVKTKAIMSGSGSTKQFVKNNWEYWGARGVMTTHTLFEAGVATAAKPLNLHKARLHDEDLYDMKTRGFEAVYIEMVEEISHLGMYDRFKRTGWTRTLAKQTADELLPTIVRGVAMAWYDAYLEASR